MPDVKTKKDVNDCRNPLLLANEVTRVRSRSIDVLLKWMADNAEDIATQLEFLHSIRPNGAEMGD